jgi:hypothetical protein
VTNPDYCAMMLVVDRSGSMDSIRTSAEDAINEFIHDQTQSAGKRTIRIAQFDYHQGRTRYETVCPSTDPSAIEPFELDPRGGTPLLDAMGRSIEEFGLELVALPEDERPGVVILAIMTDGLENSSREFTWLTIKAMVEHQERDYGWNIVYLGANQDAIEVGARMGIQTGATMTYAATDHGTRSVVGSMTSYVAAAAAGQSAAFTDEQREDAVK